MGRSAPSGDGPLHAWMAPLKMTASDIYLAASLFIAGLLVSAAISLLVLLRLPVDYFMHERRPSPRSFAGIATAVAKNLLAILLILGGIVLSVPGVPGQGLMTIFVGMLLLDYPGKYRFERWLVDRPRLRRLVDGVRGRFGQPPLRFPSTHSDA